MSLEPNNESHAMNTLCSKAKAQQQLRKLRFSQWTRWENRNNLPEISFPGLYIIAHRQRGSRLMANPQSKRVIYIGQTCGQTLLRRLRQFNRSATDGRRSHAGGRSYFGEFGGVQSEMYVAVLPVKKGSELDRRSYIQGLEAFLRSNYARRWGKLPVCNRV